MNICSVTSGIDPVGVQSKKTTCTGRMMHSCTRRTHLQRDELGASMFKDTYELCPCSKGCVCRAHQCSIGGTHVQRDMCAARVRSEHSSSGALLQKLPRIQWYYHYYDLYQNQLINSCIHIYIYIYIYICISHIIIINCV